MPYEHPQPTTLIEFWALAAEEEFGLCISTDNPDLLKSKLYAARRESQDPRLAALSLRSSPDNPRGEIWIVKSTAPPAAQPSLSLEELGLDHGD